MAPGKPVSLSTSGIALQPRKQSGGFLQTKKRARCAANVPGGIRTPNLLIRSQLLYPVELQTPCSFTGAWPKSSRDASSATRLHRLVFLHSSSALVPDTTG